MKKLLLITSIVILSFSIFQSCEKDFDDIVHYRAVNDFVWKGMNQYYFWQSDIPNLADTKSSDKSNYENFINSFSNPKDLFNSLLKPKEIDRFSVIYSDYTALEAALNGTSKNTGVDYELRYKAGSTTELFGWVRYILPNSDASTKDIHRGDIFYAVNGVPLTVSNYTNLLKNDSFTLNLANFDDGNITPNNQSVSLSKTEYSENPVFYKNVYQIDDKKIGYLIYNGFYTDYENQLNEAFAYFSSQNITHFILDLRYNSGGSVATATRLASMITGQFNNQVFAKQLWNSKMTSYFNSNNPDALLNKFTSTLSNGNSISSLNLNKIYILTSKATASASELIISGLTPYIDVKRIGATTTGKNVGSITIYDSPTFKKQNINPSHNYAMQPIVLKLANKNGNGEYQNGFQPHVTYIENINNLGELGNTSEPLLSTALNFISNNGRIRPTNHKEYTFFNDTRTLNPLFSGMYLSDLP